MFITFVGVGDQIQLYKIQQKKKPETKQNINLINIFSGTLKYSNGELEFEMDHWNEI